MSDSIQQQIQNTLNSHRVVLFMKGSKMMPMCGFSGRVVDILNQYGIDFETRDVLQDDSLRAGIKVFSDWPTLPQLYIDGEFIGGCDIFVALHNDGTLKTLLKGDKTHA